MRVFTIRKFNWVSRIVILAKLVSLAYIIKKLHKYFCQRTMMIIIIYHFKVYIILPNKNILRTF